MTLLPRHDRRYLEGRGITVREVVEGAEKGVILTEITLPEGKYQVTQADILILLPPSYPEVAPDMFYAVPHLKLIVGQREPRCTEARHAFDGQIWQRWSRHNNDWRPGADGIWTMLKRVEEALKVAA
ncbi:E2/UBC family protein [Paracoccus jeotgali]|uniref:E2/UBC family protein n=1 Tax=Paracoccus jeotgali TaxID=2065379 RepID=UPI0028B1E219|nr:E2/UBC family protein [Paracoccus jeotgali]